MDEDNLIKLDVSELFEDVLASVAKAAKANDLKELDHLLLHGHNIRCRDGKGWSALHHAVNNDALDCTQRIIQLAPSEVNEGAQDGLTPLMAAVQGKSVRCVQQLLDQTHLIVNKEDCFGQTAFDKACFMVMDRDEDVLEFCKILLSKGANASKRDKVGRQLLHIAVCRSGVYIEPLLEILLEHTKYDPEKESHDLFSSPLPNAIACSLNNLAAMLKFVNKSKFVVPDAEIVFEEQYFGNAKGMSCLSMLFHENRYTQQLCHLAATMINLGWSVNGSENVQSPLAVFAALHRHEDGAPINNHHISTLVDLFILKGAKMTAQEAENVILELSSRQDFARIMNCWVQWGIIPAEILLEIDTSNMFSKAGSQQALFAFIMIIYNVFGKQGRFSEKVWDTVINSYSYRHNAIAITFIATHFPKGSLMKQARTVIRRCLQSNKYFHPWQMHYALQIENRALPEAVLNFVVNTDLDVWPLLMC